MPQGFCDPRLSYPSNMSPCWEEVGIIDQKSILICQKSLQNEPIFAQWRVIYKCLSFWVKIIILEDWKVELESEFLF